jgi:hypothetical protein
MGVKAPFSIDKPTLSSYTNVPKKSFGYLAII